MSGRCDDEEADIVKRLLADGERPSQREARILLWEELKDAADEIKRLRKALTEAGNVLERISAMSDVGDTSVAADVWLAKHGWTATDRAALGEDK